MNKHKIVQRLKNKKHKFRAKIAQVNFIISKKILKVINSSDEGPKIENESDYTFRFSKIASSFCASYQTSNSLHSSQDLNRCTIIESEIQNGFEPVQKWFWLENNWINNRMVGNSKFCHWSTFAVHLPWRHHHLRYLISIWAKLFRILAVHDCHFIS